MTVHIATLRAAGPEAWFLFFPRLSSRFAPSVPQSRKGAS